MDSAYFEELITIHQDAIKTFKKWVRFLTVGGAVILVLAAAAWVMAAKKVIDGNLAPSLVSIIGAFISVSSLLPYKEITPRRITIARYMQLKKECEKIKDLPDKEQQERIKEINGYLSEFQ